MKRSLSIILLLLASCATVTYATITLVWIPSPDSNVYNVYQKTPAATSFASIGVVTNTTVTITTPPLGTVFYVTAVVGTNESDPSNVATNPFPAAPSALKLQRP